MKAPLAARLALSASLCPLLVIAPDPPRPWLTNVARPEVLGTLHTLRATAEVEVSDGTSFRTTTLYHDPQRAAFRTRDDQRTVSMGVEGPYVWTFDGAAEVEADAFVREFVLGHQFHAELLFFERLHPDHGRARRATFGGRTCSVVTAEDESSSRSLFYDPAGKPLGLRTTRGAEARIDVEYHDWREVGGLSLPFLVRIDDGRARFEYRFTDVRLNDGSLDELRAPVDLLTDEQALLRMHRVFMDGHLFGRTDRMRAGFAESFHSVGGGEVDALSGEEILEALEDLLLRTDYTSYEDAIRPVVRVSDDGTLGWVIVQVAARGVGLDADGEHTEPVGFVGAWIELYEKVGESWKMSGNVSTFRP